MGTGRVPNRSSLPKKSGTRPKENKFRERWDSVTREDTFIKCSDTFLALVVSCLQAAGIGGYDTLFWVDFVTAWKIADASKQGRVEGRSWAPRRCFRLGAAESGGSMCGLVLRTVIYITVYCSGYYFLFIRL